MRPSQRPLSSSSTAFQERATTSGLRAWSKSHPADAVEGELRVTKDGHERPASYYLSLGPPLPIDTDKGRQRLPASWATLTTANQGRRPQFKEARA